MQYDPALEKYLNKVDAALVGVSVSEKSEIITEIKSNVLDAQERDPSRSMSSILASLGEPESVANQYLLARGLKPGKPARTPVIKWLTIGFLGTFGMILLSFFLLIWKFTPLISVDEKSGHVQLLGGAININDDNANFTFSTDSDQFTIGGGKFKGSKDLATAPNIDTVKVMFNNAKLETSTSKDNQVHWKCKAFGVASSFQPTEENNSLVFNLNGAPGAKCKIEVPAKKKIDITGINGKVELEEPAGDTTLVLNNGKVEVSPSHVLKYKYDMKLKTGEIDNFESSTDKEAIKISVNLINGKIELQE